MYKEYYGLNADPFQLAANQDNLYSHRTLRKARSYLKYGLQLTEGIVLVTGESGTGKSTLVNNLISEEIGLNLDAVVMECSSHTGRELLQHYLNILQGNSSADITDSLTEIGNSLAEIKSEGKKALLVLDEAHLLTDDALAKILHLANLKLEGEQLLSIQLVGLPSLRDTVLLPKHEQLHQRLVATCRIERLTLFETTEYIVHNLSAAGWSGSPEICPKVYKLIQNYSMGIPRWINLIGSRLLLHGMTREKQRLELTDVCEVLLELLSEDLLPAEVRLNVRKARDDQAA